MVSACSLLRRGVAAVCLVECSLSLVSVWSCVVCVVRLALLVGHSCLQLLLPLCCFPAAAVSASRTGGKTSSNNTTRCRQTNKRTGDKEGTEEAARRKVGEAHSGSRRCIGASVSVPL